MVSLELVPIHRHETLISTTSCKVTKDNYNPMPSMIKQKIFYFIRSYVRQDIVQLKRSGIQMSLEYKLWFQGEDYGSLKCLIKVSDF